MQNYHWSLRLAGGIIAITLILQFFRIVGPIITLPLFIIGIILLIVGFILSRKNTA
jgi:hypothetical protein